jgi:beta-glucosidase-like glycosyl hydrolase
MIWNDGTMVCAVVCAAPQTIPSAIPGVYLADSPVGVGNGSTGVTQWADTAALAATGDTGVTGEFGRAYGAEQAGKGHNVALGPTINILRLPNLGSRAGDVQRGPIPDRAAGGRGNQRHPEPACQRATAKHFVANNQAVQAGVGAIMCSYNRVGGTYACENADELIGTLRDAWNFDGMVMSDWGAVHSTVQSAKSGLDLEMPGAADDDNLGPINELFGSYFNTELKSAVQSGAVTAAELDGMVTHILTAMFRIGLFDHPTPDPVTVKDTNVSTPEHQALSEQIAEQGTVLLRDANGALPLSTGSVRSAAVIGDAAKDPLTAAAGSAAVIPSAPVITPLDGITARAGSGTTISYAQGTLGTNPLPAFPAGAFNGLTATYYGTADLAGTPIASEPVANLDITGNPAAVGSATTWSSRYTGTITAPAWDVPVLDAGRRVRHGVHRRPTGRVLHPDVRAHPERSGQPVRGRAQHPRRGHPVPARAGDGGEVRYHRGTAPGVDWGKALPIPKPNAERFPEVKELIDQGLQSRQYTFSADNLSEAGKLYRGASPSNDGTELSTALMPDGFPITIAHERREEFSPGLDPSCWR